MRAFIRGYDARLLVVPEERQENDDRDRDPKQPEQHASAKPMRTSIVSPLRRVNASGNGKFHGGGTPASLEN